MVNGFGSIHSFRKEKRRYKSIRSHFGRYKKEIKDYLLTGGMSFLPPALIRIVMK